MYEWIDCEVHLTEPRFAVLRLIPISPNDNNLCILLSRCECIVKFAVLKEHNLALTRMFPTLPNDSLCALHRSWLYPATSLKISLSLVDVFVNKDGFVVLSVKNNNTSLVLKVLAVLQTFTAFESEYNYTTFPSFLFVCVFRGNQYKVIKHTINQPESFMWLDSTLCVKTFNSKLNLQRNTIKTWLRQIAYTSLCLVRHQQRTGRCTLT